MRIPRLVAVLVLLVSTLVAVPASSGTKALTQGCKEKSWGYRCFYGPIDIANDSENRIDFVPTIPEAGYMTSYKATLVDKYGSLVDHHAAHLHHVFWSNPNKTDLTCNDSGLFRQLGDRFFASGKERTQISLPEGYGYYWDNQPPPNYPDADPTWVMVHHLMTMIKGYETDVFVRFDIEFTPADEAELTEIIPVWLDVRNCSSSEYDIDKGDGVDGVHEEVWDYEMPIGGQFLAFGGHLHDGGLKLRIDNATSGQKMYVSRAGYADGRRPDWDLTTMSAWWGYPGRTVAAGDTVRLRAFYVTSSKRDGVMGIMMGALLPDPAP